MATQQEFADWRRHPVTQEAIRYLERKRDEAKDSLIADRAATLEEHGMIRLAVQNYIAGIGELLSLDDLQEVLSDVVPD